MLSPFKVRLQTIFLLTLSVTPAFASDSFMDGVILTIFSGFDSWLATAPQTEASAFSVFTDDVASTIAPFVHSLTKAYANASDQRQMSSAYSVYSSQVDNALDEALVGSLSYYYSKAGLITDSGSVSTVNKTNESVTSSKSSSKVDSSSTTSHGASASSNILSSSLSTALGNSIAPVALSGFAIIAGLMGILL